MSLKTLYCTQDGIILYLISDILLCMTICFFVWRKGKETLHTDKMDRIERVNNMQMLILWSNSPGARNSRYRLRKCTARRTDRSLPGPLPWRRKTSSFDNVELSDCFVGLTYCEYFYIFYFFLWYSLGESPNLSTISVRNPGIL